MSGAVVASPTSLMCSQNLTPSPSPARRGEPESSSESRQGDQSDESGQSQSDHSKHRYPPYAEQHA
jgi:hypothetical protein